MNNIKKLRLKKGISQKELGEAVHVSQGNVSQWERGNKRAGKKACAALANYFGVSVDYLMGRTNEQNDSSAYNVGNSDLAQENDSVTAGEIPDANNTELFRIYRKLDFHRRLKLLVAAFELEEEKDREDNT